jgi:hypothetical protein
MIVGSPLVVARVPVFVFSSVLRESFFLGHPVRQPPSTGYEPVCRPFGLPVVALLENCRASTSILFF